MFRFIPLLVALASAVGLTGCPPPDDSNGALGVLDFRWQDPVRGATGFHAPLAEGTRSVVQVMAVDGEPVEIREAYSGDESRLRVISTEGDRILVEGLVEGLARLEVFTAQGNDWIDVPLQRVERVALQSRFSAARVLVGGLDVLHMRRFGPFGGELVGYAPIDVTVEPADAGIEQPSPAHELRLSYAAPGEVRVTIDGDSLRRLVVERSALAVLRVFDVPARLFEGEVESASLAAFDREGTRLGALDGLLAIETVDEGVCGATLDAAGREPAVRIEARQPGRCAVSVRLDGHSEDFELTVTR